jgi:capsular exopolysaccharide synthesis family protein
VRRYWWIAALGAIIGGGLVVAAPRLRPKQYQATSAVLFETPHFDQILFGRNLVGFRTLPYRQAATHLNLITLPVVASDTARVVGHGLTAAQVAADITVTEVERSDVYTIEATASSPALATKLANAYADQFLHTAAVEDRQRIQSAIANIQRKLAQLSPAEAGAAATLSLQRTLQDLQVVASLQTGNVELIQRASPGLSAAKTVKKRQIIYGAILGFGVALLLVIYLARRDRRLSDADSLEDAFMVPVLGTVDLGGAGRRSRRGKPPEVDLEAFRLLRTELRYFNVDRRIDTLLVTSPRRADGRSTIAFQLAAAEARSGQSSVLLLEADFRGPTLADRLGEAPGPGVAEVLSGIVPLDEVIQEIKVLPHDRSDVPARLSVLPAGTVPPNPMQLLESEAMEGLLDQLRRRFDMVIIDSPPLAVVSDALPLMRLVAGVVVVTRLGELRYVDARAFNSQLHGAGAPVLGIVANSTRRRRRLGALRVRPA